MKVKQEKMETERHKQIKLDIKIVTRFTNVDSFLGEGESFQY